MKSLFVLESCGQFSSVSDKQPSAERTTCYYELEVYWDNTSISVVNNIRHPHKNGSILICPPNCKRQSVGRFATHFIKFSCNDEIFTKKYLDKLPTMLYNCNIDKYIKIIDELVEAKTKNIPGLDIFIQAKILEFISNLYAKYNTFNIKKTKFSQFEKNIYNAAMFINSNFKNKLSLDKLAKVANLSPSYFHLVFKSILGVTPQKYLMETRLSYAKKLLINSNKSIPEIAEECGFESQSYINYIFRKELNTTPKQYRKNT